MNTRRIPMILARPAAWLAAWVPVAALAHPGHYHPPGETDEFDSFVAGFAHPWSGLDHLLLALAVGWIAASFARRHMSVSALAFIATVAVGAFAGRGAGGGSLLEIGLAATLVFAGIALLRKAAPATLVLVGSMAAAGLVHGFAHGAEAAAGLSFVPLIAGLTVSTAIGVLIGGALGRVAALYPRLQAGRVAGCFLIAMGGFGVFSSF